ncbi:YopX family protein [Enterococcus gallinarum]|uniref:YopX family protein n=1 Tax=Enterococcus gallinarum TaxID=1353 RepID=UPI001C60F026|nr:YopX family protein [Enterococcus gallinarum]MBW5474350.1 hypothetical protein [Enterococcus gallinarum]UJA23312.1 hypothetical protein HED61_06920 [Enterococcus gallinarum]
MVPKFRAWDKETQSLRYVLVVDWLNDLVDLDSGLIERQFDEIELMQSTGLKDKNGVEIFEGDIVVNQYGNVGYVAYLQQEAGFVVVLKKSDYRLGHRNTGESYDVTTNHEVIGNIHSNPELLEQTYEN